MDRLSNPVRGYAWGSRTAIARLQRRPAPTDRPEAELWMGAHPDSPSMVRRNGLAVSLTDLVAADPVGTLGQPVVSEFGPRLPFLLKVLAAAEPLSLQAHPTQEQAERGYDEEERAGTPHDAAERNYRDRSHKPELLVAVGEFDALCGFRHPARSASLLAALEVPALGPTVTALRREDPPTALREAVTGLLTSPDPALVGSVVAAAGRLDGEPYRLAVDLAKRYPDDLGVVIALLLNRVRLAPGEAVWMPAGNLHAYLHGTGVEVMAASDNVLRGGLTRKHVDVPELLRVLRFEVLEDPVVRPRSVGPGLVGWPTPAGEFALCRVTVVAGERVSLPGTGPRIVLCVAGGITVDDGVAPVTLRSGESAFGPAGHPAQVSGDGVAFHATPAV